MRTYAATAGAEAVQVGQFIEGQNLSIRARLVDYDGAPLYSYSFPVAGAWERRIYDGTKLVHELIYQSNGSEILLVSDDSNSGTWAPSTGATNFGVIDESLTAPNDLDFMVCTAGAAGDNFICKFASFAHPGTNEGWVVRTRDFRNSALTESALVRLLQGTVTAIGSKTHAIPAGAYQNDEFLLTAAQIAAITDTTDLHYRYAKVNANVTTLRVSAVSLQIPSLTAALKPALTVWPVDSIGCTFADVVTPTQIRMLTGREYAIEYLFNSYSFGQIPLRVTASPGSMITP